MTFKKGQIFKLKYDILEGSGVRAKLRTITGEYEIIRTGRRFYLFDNNSGIDLYMNKTELENSIIKP